MLRVTLPRLVEELENGGLFEIILVDNGSTDDSTAIAASFPAIRVLSCRGSISEARNHGARHATGDLLCFVDADVEVAKGWSHEIARFADAHRSTLDSIVFGDVYGVSQNPTWIERIWFQNLAQRRTVRYLPGGNLIVSRSRFEVLQGFAPSVITGEDADFCQRAEQAGCAIVRVETLKTIHHGNPKRLRDFYRRERWHASGMYTGFRKSWRSKPFLLVAIFLTSPLWLIAIVLVFGAWVTAALLLAMLTAAYWFAAARIGSVFSMDPLRLMALYIAYVVARSHTVVRLLLGWDEVGRTVRTKSVG